MDFKESDCLLNSVLVWISRSLFTRLVCVGLGVVVADVYLHRELLEFLMTWVVAPY